MINKYNLHHGKVQSHDSQRDLNLRVLYLNFSVLLLLKLLKMLLIYHILLQSGTSLTPRLKFVSNVVFIPKRHNIFSCESWNCTLYRSLSHNQFIGYNYPLSLWNSRAFSDLSSFVTATARKIFNSSLCKQKDLSFHWLSDCWLQLLVAIALAVATSSHWVNGRINLSVYCFTEDVL